jgi:hypothetical protein
VSEEIIWAGGVIDEVFGAAWVYTDCGIAEAS